MDVNEQAFASHFINYNTVLSERHSHDYYQPRKNFIATQRPPLTQPLKRFQQYFGKVKPSLYQQLRNIFLNSTIEERSNCNSPQQPRCLVQGTTMTSRAYQIKKKTKKQLNPNHFTIYSLNGKELYRKAKLNKIIKLKDNLMDDLEAEDWTQTVKESVELIKEMRESKDHRKFISTPASFRQTKSTLKQSLLQRLNPNSSKGKLTVADLQSAVCLLHSLKINVSQNLSYFNVFIQEGNNSELLKMLVRRRNGWRVVQLPNNANLIWTQFYRKSVLNKRLHKREKTEREQELPRTSKSLPYRSFRAQKQGDVQTSNEGYLAELRKLIPCKKSSEISGLQVASERQLKHFWIGQNLLVHNHFPENRCISDKKNLFSNLKKYFTQQQRDLLQVIPETYELRSLKDSVLDQLSTDQDCYWIIKPGENSNRGRGIAVTRQGSDTIGELQKRFTQEGKGKSIILQRYITPLLYNKRKFDIRSYMLVTLLNRQLRVYSYEECYIRTSSKTFDIASSSRLVHLTNDAIQAQSACYGRYQEGNKLSQSVFEKYIDQQYRKSGKGSSIWKQLRAEMDSIYIDVLDSSWPKLIDRCISRQDSKEGAKQDPDCSFYFEVFGMDFMVDKDFKLWLIEVNTNPAITHDCSKVLNQLIPAMLDNLLVLAVEPVMPPLKPNQTSFDNRFRAIHSIHVE